VSRKSDRQLTLKCSVRWVLEFVYKSQPRAEKSQWESNEMKNLLKRLPDWVRVSLGESCNEGVCGISHVATMRFWEPTATQTSGWKWSKQKMSIAYIVFLQFVRLTIARQNLEGKLHYNITSIYKVWSKNSHWKLFWNRFIFSISVGKQTHIHGHFDSPGIGVLLWGSVLKWNQNSATQWL